MRRVDSEGVRNAPRTSSSNCSEYQATFRVFTSAVASIYWIGYLINAELTDREFSEKRVHAFFIISGESRSGIIHYVNIFPDIFFKTRFGGHDHHTFHVASIGHWEYDIAYLIVAVFSF